ncbi:hypothetical protein GBAR_LOCUS23547 [Geodia barretti]|uniref:Uncharacterized protein n=1 Tax=Geodia barretti TaxID=519541 RepID=A0AA35T6V5_GEOBA|nr:hypothetical protein GBAR_LOCUS23547 [Geodia barretti]
MHTGNQFNAGYTFSPSSSKLVYTAVYNILLVQLWRHPHLSRPAPIYIGIPCLRWTHYHNSLNSLCVFFSNQKWTFYLGDNYPMI